MPAFVVSPVPISHLPVCVLGLQVHTPESIQADVWPRDLNIVPHAFKGVCALGHLLGADRLFYFIYAAVGSVPSL